MQSWIEQLRPDCGALAAAAVRFAAEHGFAEDPPRGAPALRKLLQTIAAHSDRADDSPEEPFIEGAGAFLGVVLAERFGGGRHVSHGHSHGLALGSHGYFDPFACVAQTLAADEQAKALLGGIAEAEAEAKATSHSARITALLAARLEVVHSGMSILQRMGTRLWVRRDDESMEVDLSGLLTASRGESETLIAEMVTRFANTLAGTELASLHDFRDARPRLLPRLVGDPWRKRIGTLQLRPSLALLPLSRDLQIALVLQYEGRARYVRNEELTAWHIAPEVALAHACDNLVQRPISLQCLAQDHGLVSVRSGDGYDSARLLLPDVTRALFALLGTDLVLALPHRDALLACPRDNAELRRQLAARTREEAARAPHALSADLWTFSKEGVLQPLPS